MAKLPLPGVVGSDSCRVEGVSFIYYLVKKKEERLYIYIYTHSFFFFFGHMRMSLASK